LDAEWSLSVLSFTLLCIKQVYFYLGPPLLTGIVCYFLYRSFCYLYVMSNVLWCQRSNDNGEINMELKNLFSMRQTQVVCLVTFIYCLSHFSDGFSDFLTSLCTTSSYAAAILGQSQPIIIIIFIVPFELYFFNRHLCDHHYDLLVRVSHSFRVVVFCAGATNFLLVYFAVRRAVTTHCGFCLASRNIRC
jgi:hypothetical protein